MSVSQAYEMLFAQANRIDELKRALRFYADSRNYQREVVPGCCELNSIIENDCGDIARNALGDKDERKV